MAQPLTPRSAAIQILQTAVADLRSDNDALRAQLVEVSAVARKALEQVKPHTHRYWAPSARDMTAVPKQTGGPQ